MIVDRSRRTCRKIVDEIFEAHDTNDDNGTINKEKIFSVIARSICQRELHSGSIIAKVHSKVVGIEL